MPVFAFTVGSFGDILAVLQLAWEIRQNLSEAAGASSAIQALALELDSFTDAVKCVRTVLEGSASVPLSLRNSVAFILANCTEILEEVQKKIDIRRKQVVKDQGATAWSAIWAACAWSFLGGDRDIERLRHRLVAQQSALQMIFTAYQSSAIHTQGDNFVEVLRGVRLLVEHLPPRIPNDIPPFVFFNRQGYGVQPLADVAYDSLFGQDWRDPRIQEWQNRLSEEWEHPLFPESRLPIRFPRVELTDSARPDLTDVGDGDAPRHGGFRASKFRCVAYYNLFIISFEIVVYGSPNQLRVLVSFPEFQPSADLVLDGIQFLEVRKAHAALKFVRGVESFGIRPFGDELRVAVAEMALRFLQGQRQEHMTEQSRLALQQLEEAEPRLVFRYLDPMYLRIRRCTSV